MNKNLLFIILEGELVLVYSSLIFNMKNKLVPNRVLSLLNYNLYDNIRVLNLGSVS